MKATPTHDPSRREEIEALHQEVDRLAEKYRAPLVLCYFEGRTHAEAAQLLNCPVGTVSIRLLRARELLRARLTRRGLVLPAAWAGATLRPEAASAAMPAGLAHSTIKAAMSFATGNAMTAGMVPASIAQLAEGEIRTMIHSKMTAIAAGVLTIGIGTAGVGLLAAGGRPAQTEKGAAAPAQAHADDPEARAKIMDHLKVIGLAMHNFLSRNGRFPAAAIRKDGKPLLSWRVALLPDLDEGALYEKFHLDEPWDSPNNKALLDQIPAVYAPVAGKKEESKQSTYYQVFAGPGAMFGRDEGTRIEEITDGTSLTIMVVEAAKPVPWTKPEDLPFDPKKPLPELGGLSKDGFFAAIVDGSALFISKKVKPQVLRALITRNGGEVISSDVFLPPAGPADDGVPRLPTPPLLTPPPPPTKPAAPQ